MGCKYRVQHYIHGDHMGGQEDTIRALGWYTNFIDAEARLSEFKANSSWEHYEIVKVEKTQYWERT